MKENRFYNYIYLDPTKPVEYKIKGLDIILKFEPFYVGKGTGNRIFQHLKGYSGGRFMKNKMKSLKTINIEPIIIKINNNLSEKEAHENERYLIKAIGRRDLKLGSLVNMTDGGEGLSGQIQSKSTRLKKSKALKGRKFSKETLEKMSISKIGNKASEETKAKMSISRKGRKPMLGKTHSTNSKLKISLSGKGRKNSLTTITKMRSSQKKRIKSVLQYDLNNNLLAEFFSISEAARKTNSDRTKISLVCLGKRCTHNNFKWSYK